MHNNSQIKKGVILSYITIIITTLITLLYTPFLVRSLGQSEYGLYSIVVSIIGYLTILDFGFGNAIIVYTSKYRAVNDKESERKLHGMFRIVFILIGLFVTILGFILYSNVESIFSKTMTNIEIQKVKIMMLILTFNLAITFLFNIYNSIISAYEEFVFQKLLVLISEILKPLIMIPFLFMGYKSITMCVILTAINLIIVISNYIFCKRKLKIKIQYTGFDKALFNTIFGYSIWIFMNGVVDKANWSVDHFILGAVCGTVAVSAYSVASQLNMAFISVSTAISGLFLPKMSMMVAKDSSDEELTNEFIKIGRLQYLIIFLMASGLVLVGKEFFLAWVGPPLEKSYYIALILILPVCIPLIQNLGISILQAKNMHKFRSILYLCMALINIIISIPLARQYGGVGAAMGTAFSLIFANVIIMNIYYYKRAHINVIKFWKEIIRMTIPFLIPIVIIVIFMNLVKLTGFVSVIVYGILYTIMYLIVAYKLSMNDFEKGLVKGLLHKTK